MVSKLLLHHILLHFFLFLPLKSKWFNFSFNIFFICSNIHYLIIVFSLRLSKPCRNAFSSPTKIVQVLANCSSFPSVHFLRFYFNPMTRLIFLPVEATPLHFKQFKFILLFKEPSNFMRANM